MNRELSFNSAYYCIKLRSGETLFSEIVSTNENSMTLLLPMLILASKDDSTDSIAMTPWVPYIKNSQLTIPLNMVYFADALSQQFFEYYGRVVIQSEINKIKYKVYNSMTDGDDFVTISNGLDEMKTLAEKLTAKFGIEGPDFTDFEEILEKHKKSITMH